MGRKNIFLVLTICFITCLFYLKTSANDQLQNLYKEQYEKYTREIEKSRSLLAIYKNILDKKNELNFRLVALSDRRERFAISEADALREKKKINEEWLATLTEALKNINDIKGENAKDFNLDPRYESVILERRLNELEDKKQELKMKLLEAEKVLPSWWTK